MEGRESCVAIAQWMSTPGESTQIHRQVDISRRHRWMSFGARIYALRRYKPLQTFLRTPSSS